MSVTGSHIEAAERVAGDVVGALRRAAVPATGFVNKQKLRPAGDVDPRRVALLQQRIDAGFELATTRFHARISTSWSRLPMRTRSSEGRLSRAG